MCVLADILRTALYPRPRRPARRIILELALHLGLLVGAVVLVALAAALGPVLVRRTDGVDLPLTLARTPGLRVWVSPTPGSGCGLASLLDEVYKAQPLAASSEESTSPRREAPPACPPS